MIGSERSIMLAAVPAAVVLLVSLLVRLSGLAALLDIVLPALAGFLVAMLLLRRMMRTLAIEREHATRAAVRDAVQRVEDEAAEQARQIDRAVSALRHDLRGILSPALLTADRLAMSQDPVARRAGEAMISTVERAEARLTRPS